jgi:hypothetical protein
MASTVVSYDHYYGSGLYDVRYRRPNPSTYRSALRLARSSSSILDFGAGSGRYALPFLHSTSAFVCAYDVSVSACRALELRFEVNVCSSQPTSMPYGRQVRTTWSHRSSECFLISKEERTELIPLIRYALCLPPKAGFSSRYRMRFAVFLCMHHRLARPAKAVGFPLRHTGDATSPRRDQ